MNVLINDRGTPPNVYVAMSDLQMLELVYVNELIEHKPMVIVLLYPQGLLTACQWNAHVKTQYPTLMYSPHQPPIRPLTSMYYVQHTLTSLSPHSKQWLDRVPKLSQCDPVCRWLGYGNNAIVLVGNEYRWVHDDINI